MRIIYGLNPVRELLRSEAEVAELWLAEGGTRGAAFAELERLARRADAKVRAAPRVPPSASQSSATSASDRRSSRTGFSP